jgi:hypothetical protein
MNTKLLKRVREAIVQYPEQFDMGNWFENNACSSRCGTAACIAGWAVTLANAKYKESPRAAYDEVLNDEVSCPAERVLELLGGEANRLFYTMYWPDDFKQAYRDAKYDPVARARVGAERIDHFIKTQGRE